VTWGGGESQCAGLTAAHDVYFGTVNPPPFDHNNGALISWDPGTLDHSTTYYWQIVSKDDNGETAGPVWSFTTEEPCLDPPTAPSNPSPSNGAGNRNENSNLAWQSGDSQCGLPVLYDVYFGESPDPPLFDSNIVEKALNLERLKKDTTYYWRVVARDDNGSTSSPVWTFTTRD
jgi:hypothetical protein